MRMSGFSSFAPAAVAVGDPTDALFAAQNQSILSNLVALSGQCRSSNCSAGTARSAVAVIWRAAGFGWIADLHQSRGEWLDHAESSRCCRSAANVRPGSVVRRRSGFTNPSLTDVRYLRQHCAYFWGSAHNEVAYTPEPASVRVQL